MASRYPSGKGFPRGRHRGGRGTRHGENAYHGTREGGTFLFDGFGRSESRGGQLRGGARSRTGHRGSAPSYRGCHPRGRWTKTSTRKTNPMGKNLLIKLDGAEANEIIRMLYETRVPLQLLLKEDIDHETMQLLVSVLSKVCRGSDQQSERVREVLGIVGSSDFLDIKLLHWISNWSQNRLAKDLMEVNISSTTELLIQMLDKVSGTVSSVGVALLVLSSVIDGFEKKDIFISSEIKEKFNMLQETHSTFLRDHRELSSRKERNMHGNSWEQPPEDFRELPMLPLPEELQIDYKPFLRKNIVNGEYRDINHYLDIHYRLLREDFVAPLREGISEYTKEMTRNGANAVKRRFQNFRLYNNVRVVGIDPSKGGLFFILQFDVDNHLKGVKWELSKRLIFGSLVCLSRDDFKTLIFGVVADSEPKVLKNGLFSVTFDLEPHQLQELFMYSFKMAESPSYFEAYRHVLGCLQEIEEDNFPFSQYIITTVRKPDLPLYIKEDPLCTFDISSIALEAAVQNPSNLNVKKLKEISVRNDGAWPSHERLGFDESQMKAYKAALQEEVCLIQGPPGTGKTYVGLRIVKTLLKNRERWGRNKPLLVVCYTNHALDQFLEGILEFEPEGVVRIGGRSSSEKLKELNLKQVRRGARRARSGQWVYGEKRKEMDQDARKISNYESLIDVAKKGLLKCQAIHHLMRHDHRRSLIRFNLSPLSDPIAFWLGILDKAGAICVHPKNANPNISYSTASKGQHAIRKNEVQAFGIGNLELECNIPEQQQLDEDSMDQMDEEDTATDTDESIIIGNEELNRRYIEDEDDFSDDNEGIAGAVGSLEIQSPEETTVTMPTVNEDQTSKKHKWQKVTSAKSVRRTELHILRRLSEYDVMTEVEVQRVRDVWDLNDQQRWCLYRYWLRLYIDQIREKMRTLYAEYNQKATILKELQLDDDLEALRGKSVIGLTTTGAAKQNKLLRAIGPPVVVVEEAAEILEAHIITSLSSHTKHLILIGDHQQLRPNPTVYKLCKEYKLDVSLFERLINNGMPHYRLSLQHRMRPEISHILKLHKDFYPGLRDHEMVSKYDDVLGIKTNLFFVEHEMPEIHHDDNNSRSNLHEARYMMSLCKYLLLQGYNPDQITILTAYKGQVYTFRQIMDKTFEGVRVCPIDNFQGEENDIILFSFVRSNTEGSIGFLKVSNRVCVALSRARKGLYCIGNFSLLSQQSELWTTIVSDLRSREFIGPGLKLVCRNHPERCIEAKTSADFKKAPDGGCDEPCSARLDCGHTCQLKCHPVDQEHRKVLCKKPCEEIVCSVKHVCPLRCWQDCPKLCPTRIVKKLPCSHKQEVQCYQKPENVVCLSPCERTLPCGHVCQALCGSECTVSCQHVVEKVFQPCGHKAKVPCCESLCPKKCKAFLKCEHMCQGTCGRCKNGRYHVRCEQVCRRPLVCGHICGQRCSRTCPPCTKPCENQCKHNKCKKSCGERCVPCKERCPWRCKHHQCQRSCGSDCNRKPCDLPCQRRLRCKHKCIGLCGERCPKLCRICNKADVTTILFGNEDSPRARFVHLNDCNHIVEKDAMDHLMKQQKESEESVIKLPECPWCKAPIRFNYRYNNIIKAIRRDVEKVKVQIKGQQDKIKSKSSSLIRKIDKARSEDAVTDSTSARPTSSRLRIYATLSRRREERKEWSDFFKKLTDMLNKRQYTVSTGDLDGIETFLDMYYKLRKIDVLKATYLKGMKLGEIKETKPYKQFHEYFGFLQEKTKEVHAILSDQEIADWQNEYKRCRHSLSLLHVVGVFKKSAIQLGKYEKERKIVDEVDILLSDGFPFDSEKDETTRELLSRLKDLNPLLLKIGISEEERQMVVKAMGFTRGHWFKCHNDHVYAIGDCGGANQRSQCPECQATIGGVSHLLDEGNSLASEMDGARFAAYSEEANNMFNFDLGVNV